MAGRTTGKPLEVRLRFGWTTSSARLVHVGCQCVGNAGGAATIAGIRKMLGSSAWPARPVAVASVLTPCGRSGGRFGRPAQEVEVQGPTRS